MQWQPSNHPQQLTFQAENFQVIQGVANDGKLVAAALND
jgi:hypothetical protein